MDTDAVWRISVTRASSSRGEPTRTKSMYAASPATEWHASIAAMDSRSSGASSGWRGSSGLISMNAESGLPTASGSSSAR